MAEAARARAYAPYSRYAVGAALETVAGEVYAGCNVENASYGLTICAEQAALAAAVADGHRRFARLVVATGGGRAVAPCGRCRQLLVEFGIDLEVHGFAAADRRRWTLAELLPHPFTGDFV